MQDIQNIPNPNVNTVDVDVDSQKRTDIESISTEEYDSNGKIPVPPDQEKNSVPIEEPPDVENKHPIEEDDGDDIERIV